MDTILVKLQRFWGSAAQRTYGFRLLLVISVLIASVACWLYTVARPQTILLTSASVDSALFKLCTSPCMAVAALCLWFLPLPWVRKDEKKLTPIVAAAPEIVDATNTTIATDSPSLPNISQLCRSHSICVDSDVDNTIAPVTISRKSVGFWRKLRRSLTQGAATDQVRRKSLSSKSSVAIEGVMEPWARQLRPSQARLPMSMRLTKLGQRMLCGSMSVSLSASTSKGGMVRSASGRDKKDRGLPHSPSVVFATQEAIECVGHDVIDEDLRETVLQVAGDIHLLQFGAIVGERSAVNALSARGEAGPLGSNALCLYGAPDRCEYYSQDWEPIVKDAQYGSLTLSAWRRHLRKGLFFYKTSAVYEGATAVQLRSFLLDDSERCNWDESALVLQALVPATSEISAAEPVPGTHRQSAIMYAKVKFPGPIAPRDYVYCRRVWHRTSDGGCYVVNKSFSHPNVPVAEGKVVRVTDFASAFVVRDVPAASNRGPGAELLTVYFEDSRLSSLLVNPGVKKGLPPLNVKQEVAFRKWVEQNPHKWQQPAHCEPVKKEETSQNGGRVCEQRMPAASQHSPAPRQYFGQPAGQHVSMPKSGAMLSVLIKLYLDTLHLILNFGTQTARWIWRMFTAVFSMCMTFSQTCTGSKDVTCSHAIHIVASHPVSSLLVGSHPIQDSICSVRGQAPTADEQVLTGAPARFRLRQRLAKLALQVVGMSLMGKVLTVSGPASPPQHHSRCDHPGRGPACSSHSPTTYSPSFNKPGKRRGWRQVSGESMTCTDIWRWV